MNRIKETRIKILLGVAVATLVALAGQHPAR